MKVSELKDEKLDYWAAKAEEKEVTLNGCAPVMIRYKNPNATGWEPYSPSTDWSQGGPIIERYGINLLHVDDESAVNKTHYGAEIGRQAAYSSSYSYDGEPEYTFRPKDLYYGPTPLIAAMRCLVASKFGDEVPNT